MGTFTYSERDASIADRRESKPRRSRFIVERSVGVSRSGSWVVTGGRVLSSWRRLSGWTKRKLLQLKKTSLKLKLNSLMILILLY